MIKEIVLLGIFAAVAYALPAPGVHLGYEVAPILQPVIGNPAIESDLETAASAHHGHGYGGYGGYGGHGGYGGYGGYGGHGHGGYGGYGHGHGGYGHGHGGYY